MPDHPAPPRSALRLKLAALSLVGATMVALPLIQVLRYQAAELRAALSEQAALDPVAHAVALQHALLRHRDLAGQVLGGEPELELQRRQQQGLVDERMAALEAALVAVASDLAQIESGALREDWARLAADVQSRVISATESNLRHRLLVEQTLQVIDLVAQASGLGRDPGGSMPASTIARSLPRRVAEIAALAPVGAAGSHAPDARQLAAVEGALARSLGRLNANVDHPAMVRPQLAAAASAAWVAADRYFKLLREGSSAAAPAAQEAVSAQFRLLDETHAALSAALTQRIDGARRERDLLLACTAVLALLSILLARRIALPPRPGSQRRRTAAPPHRDSAATPAGVIPPGRVHEGSVNVRDETSRLLQRLRRSGRDRPAGRRGGAFAETLPPEES